MYLTRSKKVWEMLIYLQLIGCVSSPAMSYFKLCRPAHFSTTTRMDVTLENMDFEDEHKELHYVYQIQNLKDFVLNWRRNHYYL